MYLVSRGVGITKSCMHLATNNFFATFCCLTFIKQMASNNKQPVDVSWQPVTSPQVQKKGKEAETPCNVNLYTEEAGYDKINVSSYVSLGLVLKKKLYLHISDLFVVLDVKSGDHQVNSPSANHEGLYQILHQSL